MPISPPFGAGLGILSIYIPGADSNSCFKQVSNYANEVVGNRFTLEAMNRLQGYEDRSKRVMEMFQNSGNNSRFSCESTVIQRLIGLYDDLLSSRTLYTNAPELGTVYLLERFSKLQYATASTILSAIETSCVEIIGQFTNEIGKH